MKRKKKVVLEKVFFFCGFLKLSNLIQVADYNVVAAQQGIVYIDEVDKITKKVTFGRKKQFYLS